MKIIKQNIYGIITCLLVAIYSLHTSSCASTKAAPSGGPKDTIPPVVEMVSPLDNSTDFPVEDGSITVTFNEYVQVKDANKNIFLSPPLKKSVKTRIKGKSVIFTFQEPLDSNTTYSLNCGNAIIDNNEGNPFYGLSYSFSTGKEVDSMMISGTVVDAVTLFPIENATVALYEYIKDSTVLNDNPDAIARTDKWGYFTVKNLKAVPYYMFAYTDGNTNYRYDQGTEQIAFADEPFIPVKVMRKDAVELKYFDPKDTLECLARPSEITLALFSEKNTIQFIRDYKRFSKRGAYIKFNASDVQIDSFAIPGIKDERIIKQFNYQKDSLSIWIKDEGKINDTLKLAIKYHKSDSTGNLVPTVENLRLIAPFENKNARNKKQKNEDTKRKDLLEFQIDADKTMVEQNGIALSFPAPLVTFDTSSITFKMRNPKMIESDVVYTVSPDSVISNKYIFKPVQQFIKGNDYELKFPMAVFKDVNGFTNDSIDVKFNLPNDETLSSITLELKNVNARYIVELINSQRSKTFRSFIVEKDCELLFPYLKPGDYSIRITEDINLNGMLDTGDLLKRRQPEKVLLYKLGDGKDILQIKERTDLVQEIDIAQIFCRETK